MSGGGTNEEKGTLDSRGREKEEFGTASATSPRRSLSLSTADSASFSGWKRPWMSQSRVRECLVNLLNTCGQKVGLPKSPSVIFSQTSEILERQSSMASSTECVSGPGNDVSTEQSKHDTTDTEQRFGMYMRDFDFLEYELESLEGESVDNFNWGVRRPSLSNLEGEGVLPDYTQRDQGGVGVGAEESSDDDLGSVSPVDDMSRRSNDRDHSGASSSVSTTSSGVYPPTSLPLDAQRGRRSSTPRSETESGDCSDGDLSDLTPCNASPSLSQLLSWSGCRGRMERDDVEERWRQHVQVLMTSTSNENLINTFSLFAKLFKELRCKTVAVTEDACQFLAREESPNVGQMRGTVQQFKSLLGVLGGVPDCPYVWCDFAFLGDPRLTEKIKFNVLEIQENVENYVDKKDSTMESLDGLKAHQKLLSLGEQMDSSNNLESDQVELCRFMYKLHFQQLLLLESYTKLLQLLSAAATSSCITDLSSEVNALRHSLLNALCGEEESPRTPTPTEEVDGDPTPTCCSEAEDSGAESMVFHPTPPPPSRDAAPTDVTPSQSATPPPDAPTPPPDEATPPPGVATPPPDEATPPPGVATPPPGEATPPLGEATPPPGEATPPPGEATPPAGDVTPQISVTPPPSCGTTPRCTPPPPLLVPEINVTPPVVEEVEEETGEVENAESSLPDNLPEAQTLLLEHVNNKKWKKVWEVFRGCRQYWDEPSLGDTDLDELGALLNSYCRALAEHTEGIFVMTVSSVDLGEVCSQLMDISLQLLASVKNLERSMLQKPPESPSKVESSL